MLIATVGAMPTNPRRLERIGWPSRTAMSGTTTKTLQAKTTSPATASAARKPLLSESKDSASNANPMAIVGGPAPASVMRSARQR
jgi:hypothetical protein